MPEIRFEIRNNKMVQEKIEKNMIVCSAGNCKQIKASTVIVHNTVSIPVTPSVDCLKRQVEVSEI